MAVSSEFLFSVLVLAPLGVSGCVGCVLVLLSYIRHPPEDPRFRCLFNCTLCSLYLSTVYASQLLTTIILPPIKDNVPGCVASVVIEGTANSIFLMSMACLSTWHWLIVDFPFSSINWIMKKYDFISAAFTWVVFIGSDILIYITSYQKAMVDFDVVKNRTENSTMSPASADTQFICDSPHLYVPREIILMTWFLFMITPLLINYTAQFRVLLVARRQARRIAMTTTTGMSTSDGVEQMNWRVARNVSAFILCTVTLWMPYLVGSLLFMTCPPCIPLIVSRHMYSSLMMLFANGPMIFTLFFEEKKKLLMKTLRGQ